MRDPKRIAKILALVRQLWEKQPDQRFWQFLSNLGGDFFEKIDIDDLWFLEDDECERILGELLEEKNGK